MPNFKKALLTEVMPQVEKDYNATKDRNQRAIAGLSMGAESVYVGLNNLDRFVVHRVVQRRVRDVSRRGGGGRAQAPPVDAAVWAKNFPALDAKLNSQIKMLWIACGTADGLIGINRQFKDFDEFSRARIDASAQELVDERDTCEGLGLFG